MSSACIDVGRNGTPGSHHHHTASRPPPPTPPTPPDQEPKPTSRPQPRKQQHPRQPPQHHGQPNINGNPADTTRSRAQADQPTKTGGHYHHSLSSRPSMLRAFARVHASQ